MKHDSGPGPKPRTYLRSKVVTWACFLGLLWPRVYYGLNPSHQPTRLEIVGSFFLLAGVVLGWSDWFSSNRAARDGEAPTASFELDDVYEDGTRSWQRTVMFGDRVIPVMIDGDEELLARVLPHANFLIDHLGQIRAALEDFVRKPHPAPGWSEDRNGLGVDFIAFTSDDDCEAADFYFEKAPSGASWVCAYRDGKFSNLHVG